MAHFQRVRLRQGMGQVRRDEVKPAGAEFQDLGGRVQQNLVAGLRRAGEGRVVDRAARFHFNSHRDFLRVAVPRRNRRHPPRRLRLHGLFPRSGVGALLAAPLRGHCRRFGNGDDELGAFDQVGDQHILVVPVDIRHAAAQHSCGEAVRVEDIGVRAAAGDAQERLQTDPLGGPPCRVSRLGHPSSARRRG